MRNLLLIPLLLLILSGCLTEKRIRRNAHQLTDTTYVTKTVTVTIPKDSAIVRTVTDTTRIFLTERQGRATVTLIRTPTETSAKAVCDTIIREVRVTVPCPPELQIGVNAWWRVAALVLGGLLIISGMSLAMFVAGARYAQRNPKK
ncbi:hypothetical protein [Larkinella knui]|uniref:Uncharacterized protein n=1 Tax=Larkinella knui TaxID=2025310 RepID=A0A3P1CJH8_9BACT|nr:hypothetical protein [Larkinella knui]RRB13425.1 hypothetical protein EHT87_14205 [Larkinella knui]